MSKADRIIRHLLESEDEEDVSLGKEVGVPVPETPAKKPFGPHDRIAMPGEELAGIERFVRDTNNATGQGHLDWAWDSRNMMLTITNDDGTESKFTGEEIADACPNDARFNRIRFILRNRRRHPKRKKI